MPRSRRRSADGFLCASLALAAALALSAPLVHLHLEASHAAGQGLCGENHPENAPAKGADPCSLCLAGAHAPATREPSAPLWEIASISVAAAGAIAPVDLGVARIRPGTPRAPPLPA